MAPAFGRPPESALRLAVWQNDIAATEALLEGAATPLLDAVDEESGWSSLHHAFYWGHLCVAAKLLAAGASLHVADNKGRTPLDLLSMELKAHLHDLTCPEVFTWGNGANYQLGTGGTGLAAGPMRVDGLRLGGVTAVAAAKFHSAAITAEGCLLTWGWGRGGRLGHGEFDVHSGETATIVPRPVAGLSQHVVVAVAAAKHHSAALTAAGEVWTWGANRHCQLGYTVDTQATPRKVSALRVRVAAIATANKHTVALADGGAVYSWGGNGQGQLGYGTSDSAANATPRIVEAMKGRRVKAVAAAKRHTVVLTAEGDLWTWGHCKVSPRRVQLAGARDVVRGDGSEVVFHKGHNRVARPVAAAIAAGAAHSSCLTQEGVLLAWRSADPVLQVQEVGGALAGRIVVSIAAGKYRTAAVTAEGDVYMFEGWSKPLDAAYAAAGRHGAATLPGGERGGGDRSGGERVGAERGGVGICGGGGIAMAMARTPSQTCMLGASPEGASSIHKRQRNRQRAARLYDSIVPARVEGLKRASFVAVGEKHSIALQSWCCEPLAVHPFNLQQPLGEGESEEAECRDSPRPCWNPLPGQQSGPAFPRDVADGVASLQRICERVVAREGVEPRTACDLLQWADMADAAQLRRHCLAVVAANLDCVLLEARPALEALPDHLLHELGHLLQAQCGAAPTGDAPPLPPSRLGAPLPDTHRPTAFAGDLEGGAMTPPRSPLKAVAVMPPAGLVLHRDRSFKSEAGASEDAAAFRQVRHLRKKLQQIEALEARRRGGAVLDGQQAAKVAQRAAVAAALDALSDGASVASLQRLLAVPAETVVSMDSKGEEQSAAGPSATGALSQRRGDTPARSGRGNATPPLPPLGPPTASIVVSAVATAPTARPPPVSRLTAALAATAVTGGSSESVLPPARALRAPLGSAADCTAVPSTTGFSVAPATTTAFSVAAVDLPASDAAAATPAASRKGFKTQRKGGLSMFLRGDLEKPDAPSPDAEVPKPFAWGQPAAAPVSSAPQQPSPAQNQSNGLQQQLVNQGAPQLSSTQPQPALRRPSGGGRRSSSLTSAMAAAGAGTLSGEVAAGEGCRRGMSLADFVSSKSRPVPGPAAAAAAAAEGPAWGTAGTSPPPSAAPSLRQIQEAQEQHRESLTASWGPAPGTSPQAISGAQWRVPPAHSGSFGAAGTSPGALFPAGTSPGGHSRRTPQRETAHSKWYIAEERAVTPIREIERQEQEELARVAAAAAAEQEQLEAAAAIAAAKKAIKVQQRAKAKARARTRAALEASAAALAVPPTDTPASAATAGNSGPHLNPARGDQGAHAMPQAGKGRGPRPRGNRPPGKRGSREAGDRNPPSGAGSAWESTHQRRCGRAGRGSDDGVVASQPTGGPLSAPDAAASAPQGTQRPRRPRVRRDRPSADKAGAAPAGREEGSAFPQPLPAPTATSAPVGRPPPPS